MSVLAEAISVVVRLDALAAKYPGGRAAFRRDCPNATYCEDDNLARVGFMRPLDVKAFVERLQDAGLIHLAAGTAVDLVVVDQRQGPTSPCPWIEGGRHPDGYSAVWLAGTSPGRFCHPQGWSPAQSRQLQYADDGEVDTRFVRVAHDEGIDVLLDYSTGREVYVGTAFAAEEPQRPLPDAAPLVRAVLEEYGRQLEDVRRRLAAPGDALERRSLLEQQDALEFLIPQWATIRDVETARRAAKTLAERIEGFHPAIIAQMIMTSRELIVRHLLPPPPPIPKAGVRAAAIDFLAESMSDADHQALRGTIERLGLDEFARQYHFTVGMGVRNALRERGFSDEVLGDSLESAWAILVHEAVSRPKS